MSVESTVFLWVVRKSGEEECTGGEIMLGRSYMIYDVGGGKAVGKICLLSELRHNQRVHNSLVPC